MNILLVEDTEADARLAEIALSEGPIEYNVLWVKDGDQAYQALSCEGEYANAVRPDLILLDLNLPKTSGHKLLRQIKSKAKYKTIPVFVLSTSNDDADIEETFLSWADAYIVKPLELSDFENKVQQLRSSDKSIEFTRK